MRTTILHAAADDECLVEMAAVIAALERRGSFRQVVVHAGAAPGQESSPAVELTCVHRWLGVGPGTHAGRTAELLTAFETVLFEERPDVLLVSGDDDAALAAALAASKLHVAVAHLGSGLRSWDWTLPEEINRTVIDRLSDTLFTHSADARENLAQEGIPAGRIHDVGNTRIDLLRRYEAKALRRAAWANFGATARNYTLVSLRHPDGLRAPGQIEQLASALDGLKAHGSVLLLLHPATRAEFESNRAAAMLSAAGVRYIGPAGYLDTLSLLAGAGAIVTDASAVQEDASALGVPCYTLLATTPATVTLTHGTNILVGEDPTALAIARPFGVDPTPAAIPGWDGRAAERVADALVANYALFSAYAEDR
jgi:UDP-N-acetylglucosamine 2-epimerase (non-hydrolysing)